MTSASIDESSIEYDSDDGSISTNAIEDIQDGKYTHTDTNERDYILKISDRIRISQGERKGADLSVNMKIRGLHKVFKDVLNELNN